MQTAAKHEPAGIAVLSKVPAEGGDSEHDVFGCGMGWKWASRYCAEHVELLGSEDNSGWSLVVCASEMAKE